jgi:comEA protein
MRVSIVAFVLALACVAGTGPAMFAQDQAAPAAASKAAAPLNLNTATVDQLVALPGIGERTAKQIVEYREKNGPFKKAEDLMNIKGIGEKSFLRLKTLVTVTAPKAERAASQPS